MLYIPTIIVLIIQTYLLFSWWRARKNKGGKEGKFILWGFLLGQIYLLWEVWLVQQTGQPAPGSPEEQMAMLRFACGGTPGGLFVIIGLFYLSFSSYGVSKEGQNDDH